MKVTIEIDGRKAIPVRAIPFLTNWATMSPDVVADALAGEDHHFRGLTSFRIEGTDQKKISTTWWENFPCRQLKALSAEIKDKETTHETGYQEWRSRSIPVLPAGVFVWQDEFVSCHGNRYGPCGTTYLTERGVLPRDEHERRVELDFDPFIPESHTQLIVMEGFHLPDAKTSPAYEPLTELIEQYATGRFEAMPVHLQERVAQAFFPMPHWNQLAPDQRRSLAQQNDVQHDPALGPENEYWWQLTCKTQEVESEIRRWELMSDQGIPSQAVTKRNELHALRASLTRLNTLWKCPPFTVKDWDHYSDDRHTPVETGSQDQPAREFLDADNFVQQEPPIPTATPPKEANLPWWQVKYDIFDMAKNIGGSLHAGHKRASNAAIAKEIERRINSIERSKATNNISPNWDTIRGALTNWKFKPD